MFRRRPIALALAAEFRDAASFQALTLAGIPILLVRIRAEAVKGETEGPTSTVNVLTSCRENVESINSMPVMSAISVSISRVETTSYFPAQK